MDGILGIATRGRSNLRARNPEIQDISILRRGRGFAMEGTMQELTPEGSRIVEDLAHRHAVSRDAVLTLLAALVNGYGTQAQFSHPDLGGMGQWSQGGMIMIGDMFNQGLKYKVDNLCSEIAGLVRDQPMFNLPAASQSQSQGYGQGAGFAQSGVSLFVPAASSSWWPAELGTPASTGAQNDLRYAYFPATRRLAIGQEGRVTVYDTGDHNIGGFSQQQSGDQSLTFTSQFGLVRVADLPRVNLGETRWEPSPQETPSPSTPNPSTPNPSTPNPSAPNSFAPNPETPPAREPAGHEARVAPSASPTFAPAQAHSAPPAHSTQASDEILNLIERLADLRQKNILTEEEFAAKKSELLGRL
jgi:Short C-terminal domain